MSGGAYGVGVVGIGYVKLIDVPRADLQGCRSPEGMQVTKAALASDPPSKTLYDPERDGIRCRSLGVFEHWNNATEKKYSGNLGRGNGIELFKVS